jgi:muramidase (phage lysozyme)
MAVDIQISPSAFNFADAWVKGVTAGQDQARVDLDWAKWIDSVETRDRNQAKVDAAIAEAKTKRDQESATPVAGRALAGDGRPANNTAAWSGLTTEQRALLDSIAAGESGGSYTKLFGGRDFSDFSDHPRQDIPIPYRPGMTSSAAGRYQFLGSTWDQASKALGLKDFSPENQDRAALWLAQRDYARNSNGRSLDDDLKARTFNPRYLASTWTSLPGGQEGARATGTSAAAWNQRYQANLQRALGATATSEAQGPPAPPVAQADRVRVTSRQEPNPMAPYAPPPVQAAPAAVPDGLRALPPVQPPLAPNLQPGLGLDQTPFGTYADPATLQRFMPQQANPVLDYRQQGSLFDPFGQPQQSAALDPYAFDPNQYFPVA